MVKTALPYVQPNYWRWVKLFRTQVWTIFQPLKELQLATPSHATQATISFGKIARKTYGLVGLPSFAVDQPVQTSLHETQSWEKQLFTLFCSRRFLKKIWFQESNVWTCPNLWILVCKTEDKHITIGHRTQKNGKISSDEHQNDVQHK